jgi:hypothetical protein
MTGGVCGDVKSPLHAQHALQFRSARAFRARVASPIVGQDGQRVEDFCESSGRAL